MGNIIIVQVPNTEENKAIIAGLIGLPGVRIETMPPVEDDTTGKKYVSLQEGAEIAGVNYFTFRKWVVEQKRIPYERPSGKNHGGVRLTVSNIEAFLEGRLGKKKPSRGGMVKILD